ncbi:MAG: hypothetical protein GF411_00400 [Candidatus Lokiarchaeota archaeon]|nr:hypothetical protein [Candidatus Lokiarchaeota archaeon]
MNLRNRKVSCRQAYIQTHEHLLLFYKDWIGGNVMSFRAANEFGFINARIRGLKSRFLTVGDYERLLQSGSYDEFLKLLSATSYGDLIAKEFPYDTPYPDDLALVLSKDFAQISYSLTRTLSGKIRDFTDSYMNMFLAESLKSIIRGLHVNLEKSEILRFTVPISLEQAEEFESLVQYNSVHALIENLPYWGLRLALLTRLPAYEEFNATAPLEVAIEKWYLKEILEALEKFPKDDRKRVLDVLEARVDLRNVLTMMRALVLSLEQRIVDMSLVPFTMKSNAILKQISSSTSWKEVLNKLSSTKYADLASRAARAYEDEQDLAAIELIFEDYIAQRVKLQFTAFPFHLGTIIGFFNLKFYEVRNIRSIAVGVERGESPNDIRRMITIW